MPGRWPPARWAPSPSTRGPTPSGSSPTSSPPIRRIEAALPAVGYSPEQLADLERSIDAVPCDAVLAATPIALGRIVSVRVPIRQVGYSVEERPPGSLTSILEAFVAGLPGREG